MNTMENSNPVPRSIEVELIEATECRAWPDENRGMFLKRLLNVVNGFVALAFWENLSLEAQQWVNAANTAMEAGGSIPDPALALPTTSLPKVKGAVATTHDDVVGTQMVVMGPRVVQIRWSSDHKSISINVDGIARLYISNIGELEFLTEPAKGRKP